jgi:hypothetical protein
LLSVKERTPLPRRRRLGRRIAALAAATTTAAACGAVLGQATPAAAGGDPTRDCPPGTRATIPSDREYPVEAAHLTGGFYSQAGLYWPPATAVVCKVGSDPHQPLIRVGHGGCDGSGLPFLIPDASPAEITDTAPPTWGTFLPAGWYYLGDAANPGWTTACWHAVRPKMIL